MVVVVGFVVAAVLVEAEVLGAVDVAVVVVGFVVVVEVVVVVGIFSHPQFPETTRCPAGQEEQLEAPAVEY